MASITQLIAKLNSDASDSQEEELLDALDSLGDLVAVKDVGPLVAASNRGDIRECGGIAAALGTSLAHSSDEVKDSATLLLLRLSVGGPELNATLNRETIAELGGLEKLVAQLKDARRRSHERLQYTTAGALGCIAIGEECNVAIVEAGAVQAIIECFSTTDIVTVRQECGSALANITRTAAGCEAMVAADGFRRFIQTIDNYNERDQEGLRDQSHFALQDVICGAIYNVLALSDDVNNVAEMATTLGARDILAKFVTLQTENKMAGNKAGACLGKLGIKGVTARGTFVERAKHFMMMYLVWKIVQATYWDWYPNGDGNFDLIMSFGWDAGDKTSADGAPSGGNSIWNSLWNLAPTN